MTEYFWNDKKSNGSKNPRAKRRRKITDEEYFERVERKNNREYENDFGKQRD